MVAIDRWNFRLALLLVLATGALGFARPVWLGVGVGAALVTLNFRMVRRIGEKLAASQGKAKFLGMFWIKMVALLLVTGLALRFIPMHRGAFVVGLSIFVVSTLLVAILRSFSPHPADDVEAGESQDQRMTQHG